jgi:hypothetical protein
MYSICHLLLGETHTPPMTDLNTPYMRTKICKFIIIFKQFKIFFFYKKLF